VFCTFSQYSRVVSEIRLIIVTHIFHPNSLSRLSEVVKKLHHSLDGIDLPERELKMPAACLDALLVEVGLDEVSQVILSEGEALVGQ
jgi:hypothetical protein